MQKELEALQPQLKLAAAETMKMMKIIEKETAQVEIAKALVEKDEKAAKIQAEAATELKAECEADLAEALPILEGTVLRIHQETVFSHRFNEKTFASYAITYLLSYQKISTL